jgi:hypothetical protein
MILFFFLIFIIVIMMRRLLFILFLVGSCLKSPAQPEPALAEILSRPSGPSELLTLDSSVVKLIAVGEKILPELAKEFTNWTITGVFSRCQDRYLTRGELAIIIADRIEGMPYYKLTNFENCMLDFCENNPNFVEYYLNYIRHQIKLFQHRYTEWLADPDRQKYRKK